MTETCTILSAGLKQGLILEENASEEGFASYYEESKAKAEAAGCARHYHIPSAPRPQHGVL